MCKDCVLRGVRLLHIHRLQSAVKPQRAVQRPERIGRWRAVQGEHPICAKVRGKPCQPKIDVDML